MASLQNAKEKLANNSYPLEDLPHLHDAYGWNLLMANPYNLETHEVNALRKEKFPAPEPQAPAGILC